MNLKRWMESRSLANESGVALIVALMLMLVIVTMVPAAMQLTSSEFDRTATFQQDREALAMAEAGLEHAKTMVQYNPISDILDGPDDSYTATADNGTFTTGGSWPTIASSTAVTATSPIDGAVHNYTQVAFNGGNYKIRIWDNDDSALCPAACTAGNTDPYLNTNYEAWVDRDGLVEIEAIGTTADETQVTLHARTKRRILPAYGIAASVTLLGPVAAVKLTSATFDVAGADGAGGSGYDINGNSDTECTGVSGIALETSGSTTVATNAAQWAACTDTICKWFTVPGSAGATGTSGSTPDIIEGSTSFTAADAEALYDDLEPATKADYINTGSASYTLSGGTYGSITDPVTMYFDGELQVSGNVVGYGILVVDGDLKLTGTLDWNGIILIGTCTTCTCPTCPGGLTGNGGITTAGAVLIGNSTVAASTSDFTGTAELNYSCQGIAIANGAFSNTFASVTWRHVD
ncbi:MAG: pilus assembly PilX N-terminal domain-containing protein [Nitrospinae bacterium]|nr:pilus assembly PilX N-terminal domain-containing protein [Nitrospinota bacterium]